MAELMRLLKLYRRYRMTALLGIFLTLTVILSNVALLGTAGWFITSMALAGITGAVINYYSPAASIRAFAIVRVVSRYFERLVTHDATLRQLSELRVWFYQHLEPLAPAGLQLYRGGDLLSRIRADIDTLDNFYLRILVPTVAAVIAIPLMSVFLSFYSPALALLLFVLLTLSGIIIPLAGAKSAGKTGQEIVEQMSEMRAQIIDTVQGMNELKIFGGEDKQVRLIADMSLATVKLQRSFSRVDGAAMALIALATSFTIWLSIIVAAPLTAHGILSAPLFAGLVFFVMASFEAVSPLPAAFRAYSETVRAAKRVFEIIDTKLPVKEPAQPQKFPENIQEITFKGVNFRYEKDSLPVLKDMDFSWKQGEKIALIGVTGSGKTSVANLLLRFWAPESGGIRFNGQNADNFLSDDIRKLFSVVSQQTHLFNTTVRENMLLGMKDIPEEKIIEAARSAFIHEEIMALPQGYDTELGEAAIRLSGGQARRLAIAAALLRNTPFLILDEPTEGLDAISEKLVLDGIYRLMEGRSVLLITHRLAALQKADKIFMLQDGKISPYSLA